MELGVEPNRAFGNILTPNDVETLERVPAASNGKFQFSYWLVAESLHPWPDKPGNAPGIILQIPALQI